MDFAWFRAGELPFDFAHFSKPSAANWEELAHGPASKSSRVLPRRSAALSERSLLVRIGPRAGRPDADPWIAFILAEEMWMAASRAAAST